LKPTNVRYSISFLQSWWEGKQQQLLTEYACSSENPCRDIYEERAAHILCKLEVTIRCSCEIHYFSILWRQVQKLCTWTCEFYLLTSSEVFIGYIWIRYCDVKITNSDCIIIWYVWQFSSILDLSQEKNVSLKQIKTLQNCSMRPLRLVLDPTTYWFKGKPSFPELYVYRVSFSFRITPSTPLRRWSPKCSSWVAPQITYQITAAALSSHLRQVPPSGLPP
jgi:hypothetical protein